MNTTSSNSDKPAVASHSRLRRLLAQVSSRHILIVACLLVAAGYYLMSGPGSTEQSFNPAIFSSRRIVVAPALCLSGYLLVVLAILRKE